jgi:hypothetical protein
MKTRENFPRTRNPTHSTRLNITTDVLTKLGSDRAKVPPGEFVEELPSPSIKQLGGITREPLAPTTQIMVITRSWTQDFIGYIKETQTTN